MPSPVADAPQHAATTQALAAPADRISTINPLTGLSTDYLNHFTEAVMVLEIGMAMPDCIDDLRTWQPKTYREHFASSRFHDRQSVIAAYEAATPAVRAALDQSAAVLNNALTHARDEVLARPGTAAVQQTLQSVKPMIARIAAIINGTATGRSGAQASVDALFDR